MRKSVRRATLVLALTPVLSVPLATAVFASTDPVATTSPAPAGDASAVGAEVDGVITISDTGAHADSSGSTAHADALDIGGQTVFGGDATNGKSASGDAFATGDTPLGDAELAPWSASATHTGDGNQAISEAALAHINLAQAAEVWLLHSKSSASWTSAESKGDSSSDGAEVNLGGGALDLLLLHSEAHSGAKGTSDLVVINGNEIGSSDQVNGQCEIPADPLIHLICLTASGGTGSNGVTTSTGQVAQAIIGGGQAPGVTLSSSSTQGFRPVATPKTSKVEGRRITHASRTPSTGALPFTGSDAGRLAAIGAALAAIGAAMTALVRRRRGVQPAV